MLVIRIAYLYCLSGGLDLRAVYQPLPWRSLFVLSESLSPRVEGGPAGVEYNCVEFVILTVV